MKFSKGDFAILNGKVCVIIGVDGDSGVPADHLAAWFGPVDEGGPPEVWTVPADYFKPIDEPPIYRH